MHLKSIALAVLSTGFLLSGSICLHAKHYSTKDWGNILLIVGCIVGAMCLMVAFTKEARTPKQ